MYITFSPEKNEASIFFPNGLSRTLKNAILEVAENGLVTAVSAKDSNEILFVGIVPVLYYW